MTFVVALHHGGFDQLFRCCGSIDANDAICVSTGLGVIQRRTDQDRALLSFRNIDPGLPSCGCDLMLKNGHHRFGQ